MPHTPNRRLLVVTHDLSLSGAPILLLGLTRRLRNIGYTVRVLSAKAGALAGDFLQIGCEVVVRPDLREQLENALILAQAMAECDGVIANTILAWRAIHTSAAYGLPVAWWLHESHFGRDYTQQHHGAASAFDVAKLVIFPSRFQAELFAPVRRPENSRIIYYGLPDDTLHPNPSSAPPSTGRLCALHIGSLEPRKGQDILLQAIHHLPPAVAAMIEFRLIGRVIEPEYAARIEASAQHLTGVRLLGELPRQAVMTQLAEADIFILASRDEVLPVTLLEAMAMGKAIAAAAVAGVPEAIVDEVNGLLFPVGDAVALARHLERLVLDADLRRELGRQAMRTAEATFDAEENLVAMIEAIENSFGWNPSSCAVHHGRKAAL